jgi:pyruvate,water dikinase
MSSNVLWFSELGLADLEQVGGKNSSLGEMVSNLANLGVRVPDGFATTAEAYRRFIGDTGLSEKITASLAGLDTEDVQELARIGKEIRDAVVNQRFPADLEADIRAAYDKLAGPGGDPSFAVRSSATAEDLPDASFAGQQETFLNISGIDAILTAIREVLPRCTTTGPSPTGCTTPSSTTRSPCRRGCSGWFVQTSVPPG